MVLTKYIDRRVQIEGGTWYLSLIVFHGEAKKIIFNHGEHLSKVGDKGDLSNVEKFLK